MKRTVGLIVTALFLSAAALVAAKDYQVTGPVVDVKDDAIIVKKGTENWEIARDKDTKTTGEIKKGDKVMIKYKMTATSIEAPKAKTTPKLRLTTNEIRYQNQDKVVVFPPLLSGFRNGPPPAARCFLARLFFPARFCYGFIHICIGTHDHASTPGSNHRP